MQTYDPTPGTHIDDAIITALAIARQRGDDVTFTFNGVDMVVAADVAMGTAAFVDYHKVWADKMEANAAAYRASPEGIRAQQEANERLARCKEGNALLSASLPSALLGPVVGLLDWLCDLERYGHVDAPVDYPGLAQDFIAAGYLPNVNVDTAFHKDDPDNFARYIIGQCVASMTHGMPPHGIIHKFVDDWKAAFVATAEAH